jgi:hypothetical protein
LRQLFKRFGINDETADEIQEQMFETIDDFVDWDADEFRSFFKALEKSPATSTNKKIWVNPKQREKIVLLHASVRNRVMLGTSYHTGHYSESEAKRTKERRQLLKERQISVKSQDLVPPSKFKSFFKWIDFHDSFHHYLSRIIGVSTCPLTYVIRDEKDPLDKWKYPSQYHSSMAYYVDCVILEGTWYETDNSRVWSELKTACDGTTAWEYIKMFEKTEDGRGAYLKLKLQGNTSNSKVSRVTKSLKIIRDTVWTGPKQHFTFDDFVAKFVMAYSDLELMNYPQGEIQKVDQFLENIHDPRTQNAKDAVFGDSNLQQDFVGAYTHMQNVLNKRKISRLAPGSRRNARASAVGTTFSRENGGVEYKGTIELKHYPPAVYKTFSKTQRERLRKLRSDSKSAPDKRKASAVTVEDDDDESPSDGAGPRFGSSGRKSTKKSKQSTQ